MTRYIFPALPVLLYYYIWQNMVSITIYEPNEIAVGVGYWSLGQIVFIYIESVTLANDIRQFLRKSLEVDRIIDEALDEYHGLQRESLPQQNR